MSKYASHMYNLSYIGSHWDFKLLLSKQVVLKTEIAVIRILPLWARLLALSNLILHRSSFGFSDQLFVDVLYFVERFLPILFAFFTNLLIWPLLFVLGVLKIVCVIQFQGQTYYLNQAIFIKVVLSYDHMIIYMYKSCSLISYDHTIIYDTCYDHTIIYDTCYASPVIFLEIFYGILLHYISQDRPNY